MSKKTTITTHDISEPWWGLRRSVSPCFGARLVQEGLMKQLELMLTSGELNPRHKHRVTLYAKGLTCEADTLGSHGYVYIAIYPTPVATA
ncbi:MAG: type IV toxin-antitoxin system YeeU family antitoxin [Raoultella sp.]|nr:type IV toxin-antitoxin system YeeU family antitoxin [Raoultella sp.]